MKLNRDGLRSTKRAECAANSPPGRPELVVESRGDGTVAHMQTFLDCIGAHEGPDAGIMASVATARAAHTADADRSGNVWKAS